MRASATLDRILEVGIIPIVRTDDPDDAMQAIEAIYNAGLPILEVTMTVPGALRTLEEASDRFGDTMVLGAGTVLDPMTARASMLAGAQFCVTPALDTATIEMCNRYSTVVVPGGLTPTEIMTAWNAGATMVKVFPAGLVGGARYIKAVKAPLPHVHLVPTGGVTIDNAGEFFRAGASAVAVGSDIVNKRWLMERDFGRIEMAARGFLHTIAQSRAA